MYGQPLSFWQRFMQRFQPTPENMAQAELKQAELDRLQAQSEAEYAQLRTQIHLITVDYHAGRILRLKEFLDPQIDHLTVSSIDITELINKDYGKNQTSY